LPSSSTSASRMLAFLIPADVSSSFKLRGGGRRDELGSCLDDHGAPSLHR
jgi:hypothetical protein